MSAVFRRAFACCWRFFLVIFVTAIIASAETWDISGLGMPHSRLTTVDDLVRGNYIDMFQQSCLGGTNFTMHSDPNPVRMMVPGIPILEGTTIWINEFQAVGHAMFDIPILQLLHLTDVNRIVLQRAPCARKDFCEGVGTWAGFFRGLYFSMLASANKSHVPVYVRFYENESSYQPKLSSVAGASVPPIPVRTTTCFERVFRRHCDPCFHNSISQQVARAFKRAAYQFAISDVAGDGDSGSGTSGAPKSSLTPLAYARPPHDEVVVTLAHRGNHYRSIADYRVLAKALNDALSILDSDGKRLHNVTFNVLNTSTLAQKVASEQIREFHKWQVIVATHGAFEGNVVFFREGALLVEICGKEPRRWTEQCKNFRHLSHLFLVFHRTVKAADLREERQDKYTLAKPEIDHIVAIVLDYLSQKPWLNVRDI